MKYPDLFNAEISRIGVAESRAYNLEAGILMAGMVATSLGPRGMEKMYVDILDEATVTKHGGAFLRKIDVDHPAAKAVVDAVNTVDTHVGDGTITAAVLIGGLLSRAQGLMRWGIPVSVVIRGLEMGQKYLMSALDDMGIDADVGDRRTRRRIVTTCLAGKVIAESMADGQHLVDLILEAVERVTDKTGRVDVDMIKIEEKPGNSADIEIVRGTLIDKPADDAAMPGRLADVRVLLLNDPLEATRTKTESVIEMTSPDHMGLFKERQDADVLDTVRRVVDSGAGLVVSRKGIGDAARRYLAERGIVSIRRVKYNDLWWLERSTGARTCHSVDDISQDELGVADTVYQRTVGGDPMIFVESGAAGSVTILLRAVSKRYTDEFHRTVLNAVRALENFVKEPQVICGGGACEAVLAGRLRGMASLVEGREQKVLEGFADALEDIPRTLAANVGMNPLDVIPKMRSLYMAKPTRWWGIDAATRSVACMSEVIETCAVKRQIIKTSVEAVNQILAVDDVFMKDLIDNTHCHIDGTVHAHKDPGRNHNHWEQEGIEQRQMHQYY